jgi:hypothetical protein
MASLRLEKALDHSGVGGGNRFHPTLDEMDR